jgi:hypothetical protein
MKNDEKEKQTDRHGGLWQNISSHDRKGTRSRR